MVAKENIRKEFSKRLHQACDASGVRVRGRAVDIQAYLKSQRIHATTTAIGKWLNAEAIPEAEKLRPLAIWLKVRPEWLEYGLGAMAPGSWPDSNSASEGKESNVVPMMAKRRPEKGFVTIPHFDVQASMGTGKFPPTHAEVIREMTVHLDWLRTQGVSYSALENLAIITGDGDSMLGTFSDGDSLLVDRGINEIRTDAIYVFTLDGDLYIKRLQRMTGGSLRMISDNIAYPPIIIEGSDLEKIHIQARVLLVWNARKL